MQAVPARADDPARANGRTIGGARPFYIFNLVMAGLHGAQALAMLLLSRDFRLPINVSYLAFNEQTQRLDPAIQQIGRVPLAWLMVGFLLLSSLAHACIATLYRRRYERELPLGLNRARWIEYSLSASVMMVGIALLVGVYDLGSLVMIFGLVAVMNLTGLVMELDNQGVEPRRWSSFWVGCVAGIVPWLVVGLYFWASSSYGGGNIPTFVYWIYVSIFLFFNCFAVNMYLQYKRIGPWRDYLYGERVYMILSLVAKSALAWQVFAGTLRP